MAKKPANSRGKAAAVPASAGGDTHSETGRASSPPPKNAKGSDSDAEPREKRGKKSAEAKAAAGERPRVGLRGAAPWAARHARKHAEEAAARNAEPEEAERIKARISELHNLVVKIRGMRKNLNNNFYEVGLQLVHIRDTKLYEGKGYTSIEAFAERELDYGKSLTLNLLRIPTIFIREAALQHGLEALAAALTALDEAAGKGRPGPPVGRGALPLKPPSAK
jgi:hypothetical protein